MYRNVVAGPMRLLTVGLMLEIVLTVTIQMKMKDALAVRKEEDVVRYTATFPMATFAMKILYIHVV